MNITASGFAPEEDEFEKAGLHKADSIRVAAKRVAESPIQFECEYMQTIRYSWYYGRRKKVLWIRSLEK